MALPPINTRFVDIKSEGIDTSHATRSAAASPVASVSRLTAGQLLEATVIKVTAGEVWLESANQILRTTPLPLGAIVGERLLLKVLDPNTLPPRLKLITDDDLPASLLAGLSSNLRSLLFRHRSLEPTLSLLTQLMTNLTTLGKSAQEHPALQELFDIDKRAEKRVDAALVKELLEKSGLFKESASKIANSVGQQSDLKSLLISLLNQDLLPDSQTLQTAIEGIISSQIKALDAQVNGNIFYSFLLPFLGHAWIEAQIRQNQDEVDRDQWRVHLTHHSTEMGAFAVDILMRKREVSIIFKSNQPWIVDLINSNQQRLIDAVIHEGLILNQISAIEIKEQKHGPYDEAPDHAIFDLRV